MKEKTPGPLYKSFLSLFNVLISYLSAVAAGHLTILQSI
jgi:hypothetical protein